MGEALGVLLGDAVGLVLGDALGLELSDAVGLVLGAGVVGWGVGEDEEGAPVAGVLTGDPVTGALDTGEEVLADLDPFVDLAATGGIVVLEDFSALEF